MEKYKYTNDWFSDSEIRAHLLKVLDSSKEHHILEIGCYEGLSSVYFADNLLNNLNSTLTCVDPFLSIDNNDHFQYLENGEENNFVHNISNCKNTEKITINKVTSDMFFETNDKTFDFIYIDGSHEIEFIARDMENSFKVLEEEGVMWMDDYRGGDDDKIKNTMDAFLDKHNGTFELIHMGYQLAIKKVNNNK